jgi:hypothetical protein
LKCCQKQAGENAGGVGDECVPVAGTARADELGQFQEGAEQEEGRDSRLWPAGPEAAQTGKGGEDRTGGEVLHLVVHARAIDQAKGGASGGQQAADDDRPKTEEPGEMEMRERGSTNGEAIILDKHSGLTLERSAQIDCILFAYC